MLRRPVASSTSSHRTTASPSRALANGPRLSAARQRRLDQLLHKTQTGSITKHESAELEAMLDEVDRKSFWVLARAIVEKRNADATRPPVRRSRLSHE